MLVHYHFTTTSWMTWEIFTKWVMVETNLMTTKNTKILILLDNASNHIVHGEPRTMIVVVEALVLSNVAWNFFPANVTSVVWPLCQRVIATFSFRSGWDFEIVCNNKNYSRNMCFI
jgi:hypothetical protein